MSSDFVYLPPALLFLLLAGGGGRVAVYRHSTHYPALSVLLEPVFAKHHMPMPGWKHSYRDV